jgi:hypothetical protein
MARRTRLLLLQDVPSSCVVMKETDANPADSATSSPRSGNRSNRLSVTRVSETDQSLPRDGDLERAQTAHDGESPPHGESLATVSTAGPVHSVFTKNQKRFIVCMASFGGFFSPISANIYFPALNALALDLGVTSTLINLTLTSYMVC